MLTVNAEKTCGCQRQLLCVCLGVIPAGSENLEDMFAVHLEMGQSVNMIDLCQLKPPRCFVNGCFFQVSYTFSFVPSAMLTSALWRGSVSLTLS